MPWLGLGLRYLIRSEQDFQENRNENRYKFTGKTPFDQKLIHFWGSS